MKTGWSSSITVGRNRSPLRSPIQGAKTAATLPGCWDGLASDMAAAGEVGEGADAPDEVDVDGVGSGMGWATSSSESTSMLSHFE